MNVYYYQINVEMDLKKAMNCAKTEIFKIQMDVVRLVKWKLDINVMEAMNIIQIYVNYSFIYI
jgi:hypothetical protein